MPWCPKCHSEYRPGYSTCADCGAELADQEPVSLRIPKTKILGIKTSYLYFLCIVSVGFIAHFIAMLVTHAASNYPNADLIAIAMLIVSLIGFFVVPLIPHANPVRVISGSILGGVIWFALLLSCIWELAEFTIYLFVVSATLTAVSVSAHQLRENYSLRNIAEVVLLVSVLTSTPLIIQYIVYQFRL